MAKEKPTSITKEQLEKIQSIVSNINQFNLEIGRIKLENTLYYIKLL